MAAASTGFIFLFLLLVLFTSISSTRSESSFCLDNGCVGQQNVAVVARKLLQMNSNDGQRSFWNETRLPSRVDPLNGLKKYRGGYDIENKHYWASAAFTGVVGYTLAALLTVVGIVVLALLIFLQFRRRYGLKETCSPPNSLDVVFTVVFALASVVALICCCLILAGNRKLNFEARRIEAIIIGAANDATVTIYNVSDVMSRISSTLQPYNDEFAASKTLSSTESRLHYEAMEIQTKVEENKEPVHNGLRAINVTVVVFSSLVMLLLLVSLAMAAAVRMQQKSQLWRWLFFSITLVLWTLAIFSWLAFGLSYMSSNILSDTCVALEEYRQDPYNNALSSLLPCVNLKDANDSVVKMRESLYRVITQANTNISRLRTKLDVEDNDKIPEICNPFSGPPNYTLTGKCVEGTVTVGRVPEVLEPYQCHQSSEQECVTAEGKHIPSSIYKTILAYSSAAATLIDATPSLESLTNCSFVVDAFAVIVDERCGPAKEAVRRLWASFAALSIAAVVLLILYVRQLYTQTVYIRVSAAATQMASPASPNQVDVKPVN